MKFVDRAGTEWPESHLWEFKFASPAQAKRVAAKMKKEGMAWQRGSAVFSSFQPRWANVGEAPFHTFPPTSVGDDLVDPEYY